MTDFEIFTTVMLLLLFAITLIDLLIGGRER